MRLLKRAGILLVLFIALSVVGFFLFVKQRYVVPVLMYHKISAPESRHELNLVSPESFARQMEFLKNNGYHVLSAEELVEGTKNSQRFKPGSVVITFDDGFEDNFTNALPVLKKHGFPAILFMVSDFAGTPGYVTWDQLKAMDAAGFKVGGHTRRHAYLPDIKDEAQLQDEIVNGKIIIETYLGKPIDFFSYPHGGFSDHIIEVVKKAGYQAAFATNRGRDRLNRNIYEFNRIRIKDGDNNFELWAKLSGYYNLFRKSKNPY